MRKIFIGCLLLWAGHCLLRKTPGRIALWTAGRKPCCAWRSDRVGNALCDGPDRLRYIRSPRSLVIDDGTYYLHYDRPVKTGWLSCLATSKTLRHWENTDCN